MRVLIDIGHPAHVHYYKNIISILEKKGVRFIVTARKKEFSHHLLNKYKINYIDRGSGSNSVLGKLIYTVKADFLILKISIKFKPKLMLSFGAPYISHVGYVLGIPTMVMDDTENAKLGQLFYKHFATVILSPSTFKPYFGRKHEKFNGYMELCYLHPKYFRPDENVLIDLGVNEGEVYSVLRFVGWKAHHDIGHKGLQEGDKRRIVDVLEGYGRVFISSESELPNELLKYRLPTQPEQIHSVLYYSSLFFGESATMASESAVLGTPSIYLDNDGRGYTDEQQEKYGLVNNFKESHVDIAVEKAEEILLNYQPQKWHNRRNKLLREKIDVTQYLVEKIYQIITVV